jgi:hypothetical protein
VAKRRSLAFVRAGDDSLHPGWLNDQDGRNFDLYISYYGNSPGRYAGECEYYEAIKGLKWTVIAEFFAKQQELLSSYESCWFPDDDLSCNGSNLAKMFNLFHQHDLWLAQPGLGPGSYVTHPITSVVAGVSLHFSDFVEIMCPIFSRATLDKLGHTFALSKSGWGLDLLWPFLLGYPTDRIAVIDETPVVHTRPMMSGKLYENCKQLGIDPRAENRAIMAKYSIPKPGPKIFGTIPLQSTTAS